MSDQYWPDDGLEEDLPDQRWPHQDPELPNTAPSGWGPPSYDPIGDIHAAIEMMAKSGGRVAYTLGRTMGKGWAVAAYTVDEDRHFKHGHWARVSDHNPDPIFHIDIAEPKEKYFEAPMPDPPVGDVNYKKLPNGKYMPVPKRGSGPPVEPFKKRGKK